MVVVSAKTKFASGRSTPREVGVIVNTTSQTAVAISEEPRICTKCRKEQDWEARRKTKPYEGVSIPPHLQVFRPADYVHGAIAVTQLQANPKETLCWRHRMLADVKVFLNRGNGRTIH